MRRLRCFEHGGLPRSGLGKAMRYVLKYWDGLTRFIDDPRVQLHNNAYSGETDRLIQENSITVRAFRGHKRCAEHTGR